MSDQSDGGNEFDRIISRDLEIKSIPVDELADDLMLMRDYAERAVETAKAAFRVAEDTLQRVNRQFRRAEEIEQKWSARLSRHN
jgi:hypothetical protein